MLVFEMLMQLLPFCTELVTNCPRLGVGPGAMAPPERDRLVELLMMLW